MQQGFRLTLVLPGLLFTHVQMSGTRVFSDVHDLSAFTAERGVEFNIEGNPTEEFLKLVHQVVPAQCTLVPDAPDQRTSDHGWDLSLDGPRLRPIIADLRDRGIRVSLFMDPDPTTVGAAAGVGADRIEIYTEPYAEAFGTINQEAMAEACAACAPMRRNVPVLVLTLDMISILRIFRRCVTACRTSLKYQLVMR